MTGRGSQVARGLQTIASRIQKSTESLAAYGIATKNADGSMRSTYEVLKDLSEIWGTLSDTQRTVLGEELAGLNQYKVLTSVLQNFETAIGAVTTAEQSQGSALRENAAYMDSLQAKTAELQSAWEQFSNSVVDSDLVKMFLGAGTSILKVLSTDLGAIITQFTLLSGVGTGAVALIGQFGKNLLEAIPSLTGVGKALSGLTAYALPLGVALAGVTAAVVAGISSWNEYRNAVYGVADELKDTLKASNEAFQETSSSIEATSIVAKGYTDRLSVLANQTSKTNEDINEMSRLVELLNGLYPDLGLQIDTVTGKLNMQTVEINSQIDAWKRLATQQAYQQQLQQQLSAYASADIEMQKKQTQMTDIETRRKTAEEAVAKAIKKRDAALAQAEPDITAYMDLDEVVRQRQAELELIDIEQKQLQSSIDATQKALDAANAQIEETERLQDAFLNQKGEGGTPYRTSSASGRKKPGKFTEVAFDGSYTYAPDPEQTKFDYEEWLKTQKHYLNIGQITEAQYYANLQSMLDKYNDESIISMDDRWKAEEAIYKYKQNLTKQQQQDYEQAVKDAKTAAKEEYQTQKQTAQNIRSAFSAWQDEQDYLLTIGQITESEYYDNLKKKNEEYFKDKEEYLSEYWTNLEKIYKWESEQLEAQFDEWQKVQEHRLAMDEITESEYYTELKKKNEEYFADNEKYLDKYWKNEESWYKWKKQQIEDIHTATEDALDAEIEKEKEKLQLKKTEAETRKTELEAQQKELEQLSKYAQKIADEQIDAIDDKISALKDDADAITKKYKDQIDALEEQNQAIDDQINKQKLLEALAKAQQTKKYVFKDGRFQYVSDVDAINEAQSQLDKFNREQALQEQTKLLEKQRDLELEQNELQQKLLEEEKQRWQDYKTGWANLTDAYDDEQNELLALQKLGIDIEKATWDERLSNLDSFKQQYIDLAKQIKEAEAEIAGYDTSISNVDSSEMRDAKIREMMKANSAAWHETTDESERERLHEANNYLNSLLSSQGTYNEASGKWSNLSYQSANSGLSAQSVLSGFPMMSTPQTPAAAIVTSGMDRIKQNSGQTINLGNVTLPGVTNAKQFVSELKNMALQAAYSRG